MPLSKVPGYLERRGLGRRVSVQAVYRWATHGAGGIVLESIRIGETTVTSVEALQRWVAARTHAKAAGRQSAATSSQLISNDHTMARPWIPSEAETSRILMDHRIVPTPLDATLAKLGMDGNVGYVSDVLHRAGLRTEADVARMSKGQLLAIPRLGPFGRSLVEVLKERVDHGEAAAKPMNTHPAVRRPSVHGPRGGSVPRRIVSFGRRVSNKHAKQLHDLGQVVLDARRLASGLGWTADLDRVRHEAARHCVERKPAWQREVGAWAVTIPGHSLVEEAYERANASQKVAAVNGERDR